MGQPYTQQRDHGVPCRQLAKTPSIVCHDDATELIDSLRQHSSWHGRTQPPRISVVINPVSGQGKCAPCLAHTAWSTHVLTSKRPDVMHQPATSAASAAAR